MDYIKPALSYNMGSDWVGGEEGGKEAGLRRKEETCREFGWNDGARAEVEELFSSLLEAGFPLPIPTYVRFRKSRDPATSPLPLVGLGSFVAKRRRGRRLEEGAFGSWQMVEGEEWVFLIFGWGGRGCAGTYFLYFLFLWKGNRF